MEFLARLRRIASAIARPALGLGLALASPGPALAEAADTPAVEFDRSDADPALWRLSDEDTTIYLFGTLHFLKKDLVWLDDGVAQALAESGELVIEMVPPPLQEAQDIIGKLALIEDGTTLSDRLTPEQEKRLAITAAELGIPIAELELKRPWYAAVMLAVAPLPRLGYDPALGAEAILLAKAQERKMPISGLETFAQQMSFFANLPEDDQIAFLMSGMADLSVIGQSFADMEKAWALGDVAATATMLNESLAETPALFDTLIAHRNERWADWIEQRMNQPGTVFIAVGSGHLAGDSSVQHALAERGWEVERVAY